MAKEYEYIAKGQNNKGWTMTWEAGGRYPMIAKRLFETLAKAEQYINAADDNATPGLILSVFNDGDNNGVYQVEAIGQDGVRGKLKKVGSGTGAVQVSTYAEAKNLATDKNKGQVIYIENPGHDETAGDYTAGAYVVTGSGTIAKLGTTSASGDLAGDVSNLMTNYVKSVTINGDGSHVTKGSNAVDLDFAKSLHTVSETGELSYETGELSTAPTSKAVVDLVKAVASDLTSRIPKFSIEVLNSGEELPSENINLTAIYLKPVDSGEAGNMYEEYVWNAKTNKFELLGTQKCDLNGYATQTYVGQQIENLNPDAPTDDSLTFTDNLINNIEVKDGKIVVHTVNLVTIKEKLNLSTSDISDGDGKLNDTLAADRQSFNVLKETVTDLIGADTGKSVSTISSEVFESKIGDSLTGYVKDTDVAVPGTYIQNPETQEVTIDGGKKGIISIEMITKLNEIKPIPEEEINKILGITPQQDPIV